MDIVDLQGSAAWRYQPRPYARTNGSEQSPPARPDPKDDAPGALHPQDSARGMFGRAAQTWQQWRSRQAARRVLAAIDERGLRDAGVSPAIAAYEARQPFWRPLRDVRG
jgi:uncharacterized protein YjiS (DUF1127 family)